MEVTEIKTEITWKLKGASHMAQDAAGYSITPTTVRYITFSGRTDRQSTDQRIYVEAIGPSNMTSPPNQYSIKKWWVDGSARASGRPHISQAPRWIRELVGYSE